MEILKTILKIFMLLFLFAAAIIDYRRKEIPIYLPIAGFVPALAISLITQNLGVLEIVLGVGIGAVALLLAKITKQAIGYGDGAVLVCTGAALGFAKNLAMLLIALVIAACTCALLMFLKRKKKKDSIAFIPFLLSGYVATIALFV